jgi:hypothetical protein
MKNILYSALLLALLSSSCQQNASANKNSSSQDSSTAAAQAAPSSSAPSAQAPSPNTNKESKTVNDRVPEILGQEAFFAELKGAKTDQDSKLSCTYEYIRKDGKEVLHGEACISAMGMGFGMSRCANFDNGQLQGLAYIELSVPNSNRLSLEYDKGQLLRGRLEKVDIPTCTASDYIQGKSLAQLKKELDALLAGSSSLNMKEVPCPEGR